MSKILRRLLLLPAAALVLLSTQALPAHASGTFNLRTPWGGGPCLRPDSYWNLGVSVHAYACDGYSNHWTFADVQQDGSGRYRYRFVWVPNGGCLIPNWNQQASPVVVTNGNNVCNNSSSQWYLNGLSDGKTQIVNVATGLVLDYDSSGANRGLQLWPAWGDLNQEFFAS
ncbi:MULTISPECIES: RICIN domain-containing protein [unclassified Streptomyces]|uniref:RICIN domain-containing protein n=1 Tax=unclassified Streptomyces TaxID=2593676 RepID=UPI0036BF2781